jgi:integrase/recombinase XerD
MELSAASAYDRTGKRKYLSRAEGEKFLAQVVGLPKLEALFCLTLYYTGCRISEALDVRHRDLDFEMSVVLIRSLKKRERKETRRIPVPDFLTRELMALGQFEEHERFWTFSRTTGWRIIKTVMKSAGISGVQATTKGLRHAFGVRGALGEVPLSLIQQWMGHADSATTAIYLAVQDEEERTLIQKTW